MSNFDFYSYLNKYTPELQAKALRMTGGDMELARDLYQRTATQAMRTPSEKHTAGNIDFFVDSLMLRVLEEIKVARERRMGSGVMA